ncbi:hypothetical protein ACP70R_042364 [Stipagrostis hirtigluma subsp. patula]
MGMPMELSGDAHAGDEKATPSSMDQIRELINDIGVAEIVRVDGVTAGLFFYLVDKIEVAEDRIDRITARAGELKARALASPCDCGSTPDLVALIDEMSRQKDEVTADLDRSARDLVAVARYIVAAKADPSVNRTRSKRSRI